MTVKDTSVRNLLEELGFGKAEAIVYEFGATQGRAMSVQEIQRHTSLKRPTIYYALDQLAAKGVVARATAENKT